MLWRLWVERSSPRASSRHRDGHDEVTTETSYEDNDNGFSAVVGGARLISGD